MNEQQLKQLKRWQAEYIETLSAKKLTLPNIPDKQLAHLELDRFWEWLIENGKINVMARR